MANSANPLVDAEVKSRVLLEMKQSRTKAKEELLTLHTFVKSLEDRIDVIIQQLDHVESKPSPQAVDKAMVIEKLAAMEEQWGKELGMLKVELRRIIVAHLQNTKHVKQQKELIDQLKSMLERHADELQAGKTQLLKLDGLLKANLKQKKLELLFQRLQMVEQRMATTAPFAASVAMFLASPMAPSMPVLPTWPIAGGPFTPLGGTGMQAQPLMNSSALAMAQAHVNGLLGPMGASV